MGLGWLNLRVCGSLLVGGSHFFMRGINGACFSRFVLCRAWVGGYWFDGLLFYCLCWLIIFLTVL